MNKDIWNGRAKYRGNILINTLPKFAGGNNTVWLTHNWTVSSTNSGQRFRPGNWKYEEKKYCPTPGRYHGRVLDTILLKFREILTTFSCLRTGSFANVVNLGLILKPEKKEVDSPLSFRSICHLKEVGKILERIVANRITSHLSNIGPNISEKQFGFQTGRYTIDTIDMLANYAQLPAVTHGRVALAVSIDIFNSLPWCRILITISRHSLHLYLKNIIRNYLPERAITYVIMEGHRTTRKVTEGVPQRYFVLRNFGQNMQQFRSACRLSATPTIYLLSRSERMD